MKIYRFDGTEGLDVNWYVRKCKRGLVIKKEHTVALIVIVELKKLDPITSEYKYDNHYLRTSKIKYLHDDQFDDICAIWVHHILDRPKKLSDCNGSDWILSRIVGMEIDVFKPLRGSTYTKVPEKLKITKAVKNVGNNDNKCLMFAILSARHPQKNA